MRSQPACAWGDVANGSTPIHPTTGWRSLLPASPTRTSMGSPYGLLSPWERYGLTTFRTSTTDELGSAYSPVTRHLRKMMGEHLLLATYLLVQACQPLWLVGSHDVYQRFTSVRHVILPWLPTALGLAVVHVLSRVVHHHAVRLRCPTSFRPSGYPGRLSW